MVDCDQCDASFSTEADYHAHRREAHGREPDGVAGSHRERLSAFRPTGTTGTLAFGVVLVFAVGLALYATMFLGPGGEAQTGLPDHGNDSVISQVHTEQAASIEHVSEGTDVDYGRVPPTGGKHYSATVSAGFYSERRSYGALVHSLEHGAVVVYYDPARITAAARDDFQRYAASHQGTWQSFIAVPNPEDDPDAAYVLTAWEKRLTMDEYDSDTTRAFVAEYIGRGPENPVRETEN